MRERSTDLRKVPETCYLQEIFWLLWKKPSGSWKEVFTLQFLRRNFPICGNAFQFVAMLSHKHKFSKVKLKQRHTRLLLRHTVQSSRSDHPSSIPSFSRPLVWGTRKEVHGHRSRSPCLSYNRLMRNSGTLWVTSQNSGCTQLATVAALLIWLGVGACHIHVVSSE